MVISLFIGLLFFQQAAYPLDKSQFILEYTTLYTWLGFAFFSGLIVGIIIALVFSSLKPKNQNTTFENQTLKISEPQNTIQVGASIKHCPKCNSTYTDEELNYCLRDGVLLKNVGFMPATEDPEKTLIRSK